MKFVSKISNHVLCVKPNRQQIQDGIVVPVPGEHIRFSNHEFETNDEKHIAFIKRHRLFGSQITVIDEPKSDEDLEALKREADALGVQYSPNIGAATLKKRIEEAKAGVQ